MYPVCMAKKVSIVIVSYNVRPLLTECIDSVRLALAGLSGDITVVDNCSKDDTVEYLQKHYPDVQLIINQENVGIALRDSGAAFPSRFNMRTPVPPASGCASIKSIHP